MGSSHVSVSIASHRRRRLATIMLRGDLAAYEATVTFKAKVDQLIDELLESYGQPQALESWNTVADQVIARFAYRLREPHIPTSFSVVPSARRDAVLLPAFG